MWKNEALRCPLCSGELVVYVKSKVVSCISCGWFKRTDSTETNAGKATLLEDYIIA
jgi:ribosomal protein S27E